MVCPLCELKVEEFDEPDGAVRAYCCSCNIMITITELTDRDICQDEDDL